MKKKILGILVFLIAMFGVMYFMGVFEAGEATEADNKVGDEIANDKELEDALKNAAEMSLAANLAGKAISISKTTAPHATSYPFTSLFKISHGHAVGLFFENFFKFNYDNIDKSDTSFDLKKRYDLIFNLFDVKNINDFNSKISLIKKKANLVDDLTKLNIDIKKSSEKILLGSPATIIIGL